MLGPVFQKRFRILRALGEGGMGVVYEAYDHERDARLALKTLRHLTPDSLARFKREFRALQDLHHPNLVQLGELIADGNEWFFTMELVEGEDFLSYVRPGEPRRHSIMQISPRSYSSGQNHLENAITARFTRPPDAAEELEPARFDEARLRASIRQLGQALVSLHAAGMIHRDVKPSNIRIEPSGRLVLLDFGLVAELDRAGSTDHRIVGTPVYMAPEQATADSRLGPAADLYSAGVVLHEALTGRLPFEGHGLEVLVAKQRDDAPRASKEVSGIPADLDDLCARLMRRDPALRPTAAQLARMAVAPAERRPSIPVPATSATEPAPFVGRGKELALLERAYADVRTGRTVTVLIQGESGVGKSSLVKRFVESVSRESTTCVLAGRCYEREAVPYKAFDGVIDALTRFLMRLPPGEARAVLPTKPGPLVQVFPVLRRVSAVAQLTTTPLPPMDPLELRDRAFAALRDLLTRLATRHTVVIPIDDVQWADADSIALLGEVLRQPEAPSLLFLGTLRTSGTVGGTLSGPRVENLMRDLPQSIPGEVRVVLLERLPHAEACELAKSILERSAMGAAVNAAWVAEEADGHPLFVDALARYSMLHVDRDQKIAVRLDDALSAPIQRLEAPERRILELLSMANGPLAQDVLAAADDLDHDGFAKAISVLRYAHLVTTTGARGSDTVELYHDRIRVAVKQKVARELRTQLHQRLAMALETCGSGDAQALAAHWYGAGDEKQAARYARMAADHATHALAFDRAATLYDWALRLSVAADEDRAELYERLGNALASAGRGARAAHAYRKAARKGTAARALDLHRRAADQLLRAGHIDEGLEAMRGVLSAIGMRLPKTSLSTLATFLFWLAIVRARGLWFRPRDTSEIAANQLTRVDTCWSVAFGLSITDTIRGAAFHLRALVLSLQAGETYRVARALSLHAGFTATSGGRGGWKRTQWMLARARQLAEQCREAHALGWAEGAAGVAHYVTGRFKPALEHLHNAERIWRECPGAAWELDTIKVFAINALAQLGSLRDLCARAPKYLREMVERGDLYGAVNLRIGYANLRWLVVDRPDEAHREIDEAMQQWSKQGVHLEHFYELLARVNLALYEGRADEALAMIDLRWKPLEGALLFRVQSIQILAWYMRARACIAVAAERSAAAEPLLARASSDARAMAREKMEWSLPIASLLNAAIARGRGDSLRAISALRAAVQGFDAANMSLHAAAARARLASLVDGPEAAQAAADSAEWMREQSIAAPEKMCAMMAPGFVMGGSSP